MEENLYKEELQKIMDYISLCPENPKYLVSANTGVSLDIIEEFIQQGILEEERGVLKVAKRTNGINKQQRLDLLKRLMVELDKDNTQEKQEDTRSKLVKDLELVKTSTKTEKSKLLEDLEARKPHKIFDWERE